MQMNYLIENEILFNPEDNSLALLNDAESKISISNPARRILLLLIEEHGVVVQRETFFKKVWDDYGLNASNNNLNHCISKLRKVVATLGFQHDFIVTVPKVGFIIRKDVSVIPYIDPPVVNKNSKIKPSDTVKDGPLTFSVLTASEVLSLSGCTEEKMQAEIPSPVKSRRHMKYCIFISALLTVILLFWAVFFVYKDMTDQKTSLFIAPLGVCKLYSTAPVMASRKGDFEKMAHAFMLDKNISCQPGDIFVYQSERFSSPINTGTVRDFMAQCSTDDNHKINTCISYYTNDRTAHDNL